jgi:outer membrane protein TolC
MLNKTNILTFCSLVLLQLSLIGQNDTLHIRIKDAEKYAIEHNRSMQNASLEIKKAEANQWYVISTMLPQVSGSLDYTNYLGYKLSLMNMPIAMNPTSNFTAQASIAVSGAQIVSATLGHLTKEMAQTNYQKTEQNIKSQVRTVYFSVLAMENTLMLLNETMDNMYKLESYANEAVTVGVSEQTDADLISVQLSSMQNNINSAKRAIEMLYNSLRLLLGTTVTTEIVLAETLYEVVNIDNATQLLQESLSLPNNLDYKLTEQNVQLAKKQVRINEWNYGPTLSAFYQYKAKIQKTDFDMVPPQTIGFTLNIPIFSSGGKLAKVNEAKYTYKEAVNNRDMLSDQLQVKDRQLRYNLRTSFENYETQHKNIDVSQRVFTSISNKYKQGHASSMDLTNSSINLITAQSNYIQAMLELLNAQIELETLLNK